MMEPTEYTGVPDEIRNSCDEYDSCGIFDENVWWWFERKTRDLHIVAGETGKTLDRTAQGIDRDLPACRIRNIVLHEGLEGHSFDFRLQEQEIQELILPRSIRNIPKIKGEIKRMKIPPTVESLYFDDLFVDCYGHWEPVTYAVKQLIIPSWIKFRDVLEEDDPGALPLCEPIEYWEEIVIYGEAKIPDLAMWYHANIFFKEFTIHYPKAWDEGKDGSYADEVLTFIRGMHPEKPCFGMAPVDYVPFEEEDYQLIRRRLLPYDADAGCTPEKE